MTIPYLVKLKNRKPIFVDVIRYENEDAQRTEIEANLPDGSIPSDILDAVCFCPDCEVGVMDVLTKALRSIDFIENSFGLEALIEHVKNRKSETESPFADGKCEQLIILLACKAVQMMNEELSKVQKEP